MKTKPNSSCTLIPIVDETRDATILANCNGIEIRLTMLYVLSFLCLSPASIGVLGCSSKNWERSKTASHPSDSDVGGSAGQSFADARSEHRLGTHFKNDELRFLKPPRLREIVLPHRPGAQAIWGATGRDQLGRIYFGVASYGIDDPSAFLLRLNPADDTISELGEVNRKLDELRIRKFEDFPETQMKIHSKICQASDGNIYFSTQDEHDEKEDGSKNPKFGGRLFRIDPKTDKWTSLLSTPEGLIAAATSGRYVYTLGYFGSVLYQFDTKDGSIESTKIGTYKGHVPRNFLVDMREHTFIIRVRIAGIEETGSGISEIGGDRVKTTLVELDTSLKQIAEWGMEDYNPSGDTDSHGLTGFCTLANQQIVFVTHTGALWMLAPGTESKKTQLSRLGWFHPDGSAYCASLFCPSGKDYVYGFSSKKNGGYEWIIYDLEDKSSVVVELDDVSQRLLSRQGLLIYGSNTIDNQSRAYVAGWKSAPKGYVPHVMRIEWNESEY